VNSGVYNLEAIDAATYQFTDSYLILTTPGTDNSVRLSSRRKVRARDVNEDLRDFANALVDHQARYQLDKANDRIRGLSGTGSDGTLGARAVDATTLTSSPR
jgi:His-Xaa-Ser system protein HxsD